MWTFFKQKLKSWNGSAVAWQKLRQPSLQPPQWAGTERRKELARRMRLSWKKNSSTKHFPRYGKLSNKHSPGTESSPTNIPQVQKAHQQSFLQISSTNISSENLRKINLKNFPRVGNIYACFFSLRKIHYKNICPDVEKFPTNISSETKHFLMYLNFGPKHL